jgi:tetratricopeptide (TPR) repeat protein
MDPRSGGNAVRSSMKATKRSGVPRPVTVIYFPKNARPIVPRTTQTIEISAMEDVVTEVEAVAADVRLTPNTLRRVTAERERKRRRTKEVAKEVALEENTLAGVAAGRKTPQEVADLSLFGHQLFEMGKVNEAKVIFEGLVGTGSKDAFAHTMLGTIYLALKDQARALSLFQLALDIDPDDVSALVYRGEIRLNRGKVKGAVEDLSRALKLGASDDPFVERASRLLRMAKALFKRARR